MHQVYKISNTIPLCVCYLFKTVSPSLYFDLTNPIQNPKTNLIVRRAGVCSLLTSISVWKRNKITKFRRWVLTHLSPHLSYGKIWNYSTRGETSDFSIFITHRNLKFLHMTYFSPHISCVLCNMWQIWGMVVRRTAIFQLVADIPEKTMQTVKHFE